MQASCSRLFDVDPNIDKSRIKDKFIVLTFLQRKLATTKRVSPDSLRFFSAMIFLYLQ